MGTTKDGAAHARLHELGAAGRVRWMTTKRAYRARAHSNPLNDGADVDVPLTPRAFSARLPALLALAPSAPPPRVDWVDVGCGYGGLLASLAAAFPDRTMLGLELRERVAQFCDARLAELRAQYPDAYRNVCFSRANAMKHLPCYLAKASVEKLFFCYPDPHFKRRRHRQRVVSDQLLAEYAYVLRPGGVAYFVTDVPELFAWCVARFERCPLFRRRAGDAVRADPVVSFVRDMTDEAARVDKSDRPKLDASFLRVA